MVSIPKYLILPQDQVMVQDRGTWEKPLNPPQKRLMHISEARAAIDSAPDQYRLHDPHGRPFEPQLGDVILFLENKFTTEWNDHLRVRSGYATLPELEAEMRKPADPKQAARDKAADDKAQAVQNSRDKTAVEMAAPGKPAWTPPKAALTEWKKPDDDKADKK